MDQLLAPMAQESRGAVIYARVSSTAQTKRGDGLGSQETRCREFARMKGYEVLNVFKDDSSGSLVDRPGMQTMLAFLKKQSGADIVVLIDDVSRLARGLDAHLQLRSAINAVGARLESPSIEFGEDSDSILVENLLASVSQHQRQKNAEQTINRMRSRALNGYWVFQAPVGYRYERRPGHGKILVRDEPNASSLQEALEGFASGRFQTQAEVKRFLEQQTGFPKDTKGEVHSQRVAEFLTKALYAGLVEVPNWNVTLREGHHEGLIAVSTFNQIQDRLKKPATAPLRKDRCQDFPLRGVVACADCGKPLTACWSKGKSRKHPYYLCQNRNCASKGKSIRRDKLEGDFANLLQRITPTAELVGLLRALVADVWKQRQTQQAALRQSAKREAASHGKQIDKLLEAIVDASSKTVVRAFEERIGELEARRLAALEQSKLVEIPNTPAARVFEHAFLFLANPQQLWLSDRLEDKRKVLSLTLAERLTYSRESGFSNPNFTMPFKVLGDFQAGKNSMAHINGKTSNELLSALNAWERVLTADQDTE